MSATRFMRLATVTFLIVAGALWLSAQVVEPKGGSVAGRVVNSVTGQPLPDLHLTLSPLGQGTGSTASTDAQGNFSFGHVKPGRYTLRGSKAGYANMAYGTTEIGNRGRVLMVGPDQSVTDLEYRLTPLGVIQGKVVNRRGEPVQGVTIACGFVDSYGAPTTMEPLKNATDERGEYRLPDMPAGRYYVQAVPPPPIRRGEGDDASELAAFYPSAGSFSEAQPIILAAGQEAAGVNITLREAPVFRIRGKVAGAVAGIAFSDLDLLLLPKQDRGGPGFGQGYTQALSLRVGASRAVRTDGTFELSGVERGLYELVAVAVVQRSQTPLGRVPVQVGDRDVENVVLLLGDFIQLSFRVQAEHGDLKDVSCSLVAYPVDGELALVTVAGQTGADGVFTYDHAIPGKYALGVRSCKPGSWAVKSARLEDGSERRDIFDAGMDLTGISGRAVVNLILSNDTGVVVASVKDKDDDAPAPERFVTLIPDPPRPGGTLHEMSGQSDQDGRLVLMGVAPGDYRIYAWRHYSGAASSTNPGFLTRFEAQSAKITVRAGGQAQVEMRTVQP
jgi:Carboxypeptidase regulatory-like domain